MKISFHLLKNKNKIKTRTNNYYIWEKKNNNKNNKNGLYDFYFIDDINLSKLILISLSLIFIQLNRRMLAAFLAFSALFCYNFPNQNRVKEDDYKYFGLKFLPLFTLCCMVYENLSRNESYSRLVLYGLLVSLVADAIIAM